MIKIYLILGVLLVNFSVFGQISSNNIYLIVENIYKLEGGPKTKWPYGIKSIKTNNPKQICWNTVVNNYKRWENAGKTNNYLDFLADRYCPPKDDKIGNIRWKRNIHLMLDGKIKIE
jgi:hypothetical protein